MLKKSFLSFLIFIFSLILFTNKTQAALNPEYPKPFYESENATYMNELGVIVGGPLLSEDIPLIPISYNGPSTMTNKTLKEIYSDVSVKWVENGITYEGTRYENFVNIKNGKGFPEGTEVTIQNVSSYKGHPMKIKVTADRPISVDFSMTGMPMSVLINSAASSYKGNAKEKDAELNLKFRFFDYNDNEITDSNINYLLPSYSMLENRNSDFIEQTVYNSKGIDNVILEKPEKPNPTEHEVDNSFISEANWPNSFTVYTSTMNRYKKSYIMPFTDNPLKVNVKSVVGKDPGQGTLSLMSRTGFSFFGANNIAAIPLVLDVPQVIDTKNDEELKAKLTVTQDVFEQSDVSFYPEEFDISMEMSELIKTKNNIKNIKITDSDSTDIPDPNNLIKKESVKDGDIKIKFLRSHLEQLGNNVIKLDGDFEIADKGNTLINYFNKDTSCFEFPIKAYNTYSDTKFGEGTAKVKMPAPTGKPVPTTVQKGSSSSELDPKKLVSDLSSILDVDVIEVLDIIGTPITFDSVDGQYVDVKIKSQQTGVEGTIRVPIDVTEELPADLSWAKDEIKKTDSDTVDKSDIGDTYEKNVYWKAQLPDREYQIVAKDKNDKEIFSEKTVKSINNTEWNSHTIKLPVSSLNYKTNDIKIDVYPIDKTTGKPNLKMKNTINLELILTGSLKLKTIPKSLNWTERVSGETKGILSRDKDNAMTLSVVDTRNLEESQKTWSLRSKVTISEDDMPFDLIWKKDKNTSGNSLKTEQVVLTKDNADKTDSIYKKTWDKDTGVLLSSNDYLKVGDYSGKIIVTWNLYDTLNPK